MLGEDSTITLTWKVLSFAVFFIIFAIVWRKVYIETMNEIDEAFLNTETELIKAFDNPFTRFWRIVMLKTRMDKKPPYLLFSLIVKVFFMLFWANMYIFALYIASLILDFFVVRQSFNSEIDVGTNYMHYVLSTFLFSNARFVSTAFMSCISVILLVSVICMFFFPDVFLKKEATVMITTMLLLFILFCLPIMTMILIVKKEVMEHLIGNYIPKKYSDMFGLTESRESEYMII